MNPNYRIALLKRLESIRKHIYECDDMDNPTRGKLFADIDFVISDLMLIPLSTTSDVIVREDKLEGLIKECAEYSQGFKLEHLPGNIINEWWATSNTDLNGQRTLGMSTSNPRESIEGLLKALKQQ